MDKLMDGIGQWLGQALNWVGHQPGVMAFLGTCFLVMVIMAVMSDS